MLSAIILAGGKGTRLSGRLHGKPKPLVMIGGQPLMQRQIGLLKAQGIGHVTLLVNHRAEDISAFCRSHTNFGLSIDIIDDGEPRGTAGAVLAALPHLPEEADDLLVLYGDTLLNVDIHRMADFHSGHTGVGTLFLHPNDHPQDSDLVELDADCRVRRLHPYPHPEGSEFANLVNAALYILRRDGLKSWAVDALSNSGKLDFAKDLFPKMLSAGRALYGYRSVEYVKDIGTPARLDSAEDDIVSGKYATGSLAYARPAVFLDRDGVINKEVGFLRRREDFELLPGVAAAIRRLNQAGLLVVVATNQPVIARGECDEKELTAIHARMDTLLGLEGAYIDRLYYCPHHPDAGYPGERSELKISCSCRKPEIGLLEVARRDCNIDFRRSWLVGDRTGDIEAARRAGLRSILVRTGAGGSDGYYIAQPDYIADDLSVAVSLILDSKCDIHIC